MSTDCVKKLENAFKKIINETERKIFVIIL